MKIKAGQKVRIRKGSVIKNTKLGFDHPYKAGKSYTVTVFNVCEGIHIPVGIKVDKTGEIREGFYMRSEDLEEFNQWLEDNDLVLLEEALEKKPEYFKMTESNNPRIMWRTTNPEVSWAGTGGYWHYTDVRNVEVID